MAYVPVANLYPQFQHIGATTATIDAAGEHLAYVLSVPKTGTLKKIGWRIYTVNSPVMTVAVSVETVAAAVGAPVATTDAGKTLYATGAVSADITSFSAGVRFDAINGSTGISVTQGDLISVVVRCKAHTSGSIGVLIDAGSGTLGLLYMGNLPYTYTYLGGTADTLYKPHITLEYDGEFVSVPGVSPACSSIGDYEAWNSGSNPDRRGLKFKTPFNCKLAGAVIYCDADDDCDVILYDTDGYTVVTGFPVTLSSTKRRANTAGTAFVAFSTTPTITANSYYRLVVLPKNTTGVVMTYTIPGDDGAILGMSALYGGSNVAYTTFNGTPTSGSHTWTDTATKLLSLSLLISEIDIGAGASPRFGDMTGGLR